MASAPLPTVTRNPRRNWRALAGVLVGCAALLLIAGCGGGNERAEWKGFVREPTPQVGRTALPDVSARGAGRTRPIRPGLGNVLLVYFGFASCPDVCPTTLADIRTAIRRLPAADRDRVEVAVVTVDPQRDTMRVLREYVGYFFPQGRAYRTPDAAALRRTEAVFGASHERRIRANGDVDITHTAATYVVDDQGRIRLEWPFGTPTRDITADLSAILGVSASS